MSDTALNKIIQYGTAAERAAFTPSPATGSQVLYLWYETDNAPDVYAWDGSNWVQINSGGGASQIYKIGITVDGGGSVLTTGVKGFSSIPVSGTIVAARLLADIAGDIEFDVTVDDPGTTYPPTTSIVAAAPPTLSGADFSEDTTLTGWTTAVTAGDVAGFEITGVPDTITRVTLELWIQP